ncbi:MAG: esterase/lipase family protein, partial [Acidobacteriota bacterium]
YMHVAHGWSIASTIALAVGIYVGVRVVLVAIGFALARWKGASIPDVLRVPPASRLAMYFRELSSWLMLYTFLLPFVLSRRTVLDRVAGVPSNDRPLLLIHGLVSNRRYWFWFRQQLEKRGHCVYTVDCTPPFTQIANYAPQLACAVDEILQATGTKRLVLIGHSMGGLISRAYLDQFGADKIAHVITLGTPHLGTWMTRLGVGPNVHDMAEDSPWLAGLRGREAARSAQPYAKFTCIYTYHDNLVTPQNNATLPGAMNIALSGIGHLSLVLSSGVVERVLGALERLRSAH